MVKRFKTMPHVDGFVKRDYVFQTKALQDERTGLMEGRRRTKSHDYTPVLRVNKEFEVGREDYEPGEIVGRLPQEEGIKYAKRHRLPLKLQPRKNQKAAFSKMKRRR